MTRFYGNNIFDMTMKRFGLVTSTSVILKPKYYSTSNMCGSRGGTGGPDLP